MPRYRALRSWLLLLLLGVGSRSVAQTYPFTSGPIPLCDTSTFTCNLTGVGTLYPPWMVNVLHLSGVEVNITSDHPETLQILITSPEGTTLELSSFNGGGGDNYTNTYFAYDGYPSITTGTAPFTGAFTAEGGSMDVFDYESANGTWTITVIDTACANGGVGPNGNWTPGWFDGDAGSGGFSIVFIPDPCMWWGIPSGYEYLCPGETFDLAGYYNPGGWGWGLTFNFWSSGGGPVTDPSSVGPGSYWIDAFDTWTGCWYSAWFDVYQSNQVMLGPDQTVNACAGDLPVNLTTLYPLGGANAEWRLNGTYVTTAAAASASTPGIYQLVGWNYGGCNDTALVTLNVLPGPVLGADQTLNACPGSTTDLTTLYATGPNAAAWTSAGSTVSDPSAITAPGTYTLTLTDAAMCSASADVTLALMPAPALGPDQTQPVCSNATFDLLPLYNTTGLTEQWSLNGAVVTDPAVVSGAGPYRLIASNAAGCSDTAFVVLNTQPAPALGPDVALLTCAGDPADVTTPFLTAGLTTTWTLNGATVPDPTSVIIDGTYHIVGTNAAGCGDSAFVVLHVAPLPVPGPDATASICPGAAADLTDYFSVAGNTVAWSFAGTAVPAPVAATVPGTYTIALTSPDGCSAEADAVLTFLNAPALGADQAQPVCDNSTLDLLTLYNTAGLAVDWTQNGTAVIDPSAVNDGGIYRLVVTNGNSCTDTAAVVVSMMPAPVLGPDANTQVCSGATADLTTAFGTDGLTVAWSYTGGTIAPPIAATTAGTYQIIAVDAAGCSDSATVVLAVAPAPMPGPDQMTSTCAGVALDLTAFFNTAGDVAAWTLDGSLIPAPTMATTGGAYGLVVTNAAGCSASATVNLNVDMPPVLGDDAAFITCTGSAVDVTTAFNTAGLSTTWMVDGLAVPAPTAVASSGVYTLTATNAAGCTDVAVADVTVTSNPLLGADQSVGICAGHSTDLTLAFNTIGLAATWSLGGSVIQAPTSASVPGSYELVVSTANGCADTAAVVLNVMAAPDLGANMAQSVCSNAQLDLTTLYPANTLPAQWTLQGDAVAEPGAVNAAGNYRILVIDANGCTDSAFVSVTVNAAPVLGEDASVQACDGAAVDLTGLFSAQGLVCDWTVNGTPVLDATSIGNGGIYLLEATDVNGCADQAQALLSFNPNPAIGPDQALSICSGSALDLTDAIPANGQAAQWALNEQPVADPTTVAAAGAYQLTITSAMGCTSEATVTVQVEDVPMLGADQNTTTCAGVAVDLSAMFNSGQAITAWSLSGAPVTDATNVLAAGNYRLIATTAAGCADTAFVVLSVDDGPQLGVDRSFDLCSWQSLNLEGLFPAQEASVVFALDGAPVTAPSAVAIPGTYQVIATSANGCADEVLVTVSPRECLCEADIDHNAHCLQEPAQFVVQADSAVLSSHWTFGNAAPLATVQDPAVRFTRDGEVTVTLLVQLTCGPVEVTRTILITDCAEECHAFIPTAFTPDKDGINDVWGWQSACSPKDYELMVFNRYGEMIFSTTTPGTVWDGTYNGADCPLGVYVYRTSFRLPYQERKEALGSVTLLR